MWFSAPQILHRGKRQCHCLEASAWGRWYRIKPKGQNQQISLICFLRQPSWLRPLWRVLFYRNLSVLTANLNHDDDTELLIKWFKVFGAMWQHTTWNNLKFYIDSQLKSCCLSNLQRSKYPESRRPGWKTMYWYILVHTCTNSLDFAYGQARLYQYEI